MYLLGTNSVAGKEKGLFYEEMISIGIGSYHDRPELNLLYVPYVLCRLVPTSRTGELEICTKLTPHLTLVPK